MVHTYYAVFVADCEGVNDGGGDGGSGRRCDKCHSGSGLLRMLDVLIKRVPALGKYEGHIE
jgi:hypothetical protein